MTILHPSIREVIMDEDRQKKLRNFDFKAIKWVPCTNIYAVNPGDYIKTKLDNYIPDYEHWLHAIISWISRDHNGEPEIWCKIWSICGKTGWNIRVKESNKQHLLIANLEWDN